MRDRLPAPGKENRVRIRQDNGQVVEGVLEYADDATQDGSAYTKGNVLPDDVCSLLDIDENTSEPKDAFAKLALGTGKYGYLVTVKTAGGNPVSGVTVSGISLINGGACVTDETGTVLGVTTSSSPSLSVSSPFLDQVSIPATTVQSTGPITPVELAFAENMSEMETITSSKVVKFSPDVAEIDVCAIGAGANGIYARVANDDCYISGSGGGIANALSLPYFGEALTVIIGASGNEGSDTTVSGLQSGVITGYGAKGLNLSVYPPTPTSSPNGGNGKTRTAGPDGTPGADRTAYPFGDASIPCSGAGGMGGAWTSTATGGNPSPGGAGGESGGGKGGDTADVQTPQPYMNGGNGLYYGSGGGTPGAGHGGVNGNPGLGKQGAAMFKWR